MHRLHSSDSDLPSVATEEEVCAIRNACRQSYTSRLGESAQIAIANWNVDESILRRSIIRHIDDGKKMFHKYQDDGSAKLLAGHVQANVTLTNGRKVYVEVVFKGNDGVAIYAHTHKRCPLLPQ
jgi:hypothetical protein